ncbi:PTS lactose/cellobiose transporter subunit IIA [Faecalibaculum rodentium]|uniref:PTS lactose/cellobiose transporter subunit IIA n=1 Tax=Faecalibaculum rodentium TaxID=1702221 RepID=UPI0026756D43|nr:PTS lactose/cellobiose transporter subunit IIA [Faecalibaculum rodentium]
MPKMDVQESQLVAFTIISYSGMARALVHEAMEAMRKGEFQLADEKLNEADEQLVQAHKAQTDLLHVFANGTEIEIQIIMVHAQDHLMTTMTLKEVAQEMKILCKGLEKAGVLPLEEE